MPRPRRDIVHRWEGNPAIGIEDLSFPVADICNAGTVKLDNEYLLLVTIHNLEGHHTIYAAHSPNGYHFEVDDKPFLTRDPNSVDGIYSERGVLDPRITPMDDGYYYITYDAVSGHGYRLALARTKDFSSVERLGLMSEPDTKAGALFPKKINGKYARLERPWDGDSIWLSFSDDLVYWGGSECILRPRGGYWDFNRIGAATPPMEIDQGWLFVYYGSKFTSAGPLFRLGAAILDRDKPWEVIGRTNVPILAPREPYERMGDVPNLVFSCGAVIEPNNEIKLYYGAANSCICLGTTTVDEIVEACSASEKEF
jgi:predicted GH43/DUF377 family glycosyl hydrolase